MSFHRVLVGLFLGLALALSAQALLSGRPARPVGKFTPGRRSPLSLPPLAGLYDGRQTSNIALASQPGHEVSSEATRTCRLCRKQYRPSENHPTACRHHPGHFAGRLNRVNDVDTSDLEYFWGCCGEMDPDHPGCYVGVHMSYDEPDEVWRSPATGKARPT